MNLNPKSTLVLPGVLAACLASIGPAGAQSVTSPTARIASCVIVPQSRVLHAEPQGGVVIISVQAGVVVLEQVATTTLDISLENRGGRDEEAEIVLPVPDDAVVKGFSFEGQAAEPTAVVLRRDEARRAYESIVGRFRDPALLEFAGYNLVRSSVFPVRARGAQRVRIAYEHILPADGGRVDYVLPRSESLDYKLPWQISVRIESKRPISTVYSPSHPVETVRTSSRAVTVRLADAAATEPGAFRLSYLLVEDGVAASLFAYPDPRTGGGYFLLLGGLPSEPRAVSDRARIRREVTLVIDRSGSMSGEKIEQARAAALQVLSGLEDGEAFNIIAYSSTVEFFAERPVEKSRETEKAAQAYIQGLRPSSGTNLHDALLEALRQRPSPGMLPLVLFLTDGLPTVGQTSEAAIRDVALKSNPFDRRVFTFGVGFDVNTALLEKVAYETRAMATFVLPREDVEVKVAGVFRRLSGPVLAGPVLEALSADGRPYGGRVRDVIPARLPDLFDGDQLVVLGRYSGLEPLRFKVRGNYLGMERTFEFTFSLDGATTRNAFVARIWASRQIGILVDAIRQLGANGPTGTFANPADPRLKELVDEVVRLSTEFGILTEYTSFLAREGTDLTKKDDIQLRATENFRSRALSKRSGIDSLNQDLNNSYQKGQVQLNPRNRYLDDKLSSVSIANVQQVNDRAFYLRGARWVDSRLVDKDSVAEPRRVVSFGSPEFRVLLERLAAQGRPGCVSLRGEILLEVDGEAVLVKGVAIPAPASSGAAPGAGAQSAEPEESASPSGGRRF